MHFQFYNDYSETAHPACLAAVAHEPLRQTTGYGMDDVTDQAIDKIRSSCAAPDAAVHFVSGGTQANLTALAMMLKPFEAIIAAQTGHIYANETGAIEATGHKIIAIATDVDGKLTPAHLQTALQNHANEHVVRPRVVFISQSTEVGTVYGLNEMTALRAVCDERGLYLYIDGARLGMALMSGAADWTLTDIARLADVFYIGGTKNGALLGEAIVIVNPALQADFRFHLKQRGALLAKGRVVASQFSALFTDDLYGQLAAHANATAMRLQNGLMNLNVHFDTPFSTNQIFPTLSVAAVAALQNRYGFHLWQAAVDGQQKIRLVTSWATPFDKVDDFIDDVAAILKDLE